MVRSFSSHWRSTRDDSAEYPYSGWSSATTRDFSGKRVHAKTKKPASDKLRYDFFNFPPESESGVFREPRFAARAQLSDVATFRQASARSKRWTIQSQDRNACQGKQHRNTPQPTTK